MRSSSFPRVILNSLTAILIGEYTTVSALPPSEQISVQSTDGVRIQTTVSSISAVGKPQLIESRSKFGSEVKIDSDADGLWDYIEISSGTLEVIKSERSGLVFNHVRVVERGSKFVTELEFGIAPDRQSYELRKLRVRPYAVFFDVSSTPNELKCTLNNNLNQTFELKDLSKEIQSSVAKRIGEGDQCSPEKMTKIKSIFTSLDNSESRDSDTYLSCLSNLGENGKKISLNARRKLLDVRERGFLCADVLFDPRETKAQYLEGSRLIVFKNAFIDNSRIEDLRNTAFHEFLHANGLDEISAKSVVACCATKFDANSQVCKDAGAGKAEVPPLPGRDPSRNPVGRPEKAAEAKEKEVVRRAQAAQPVNNINVKQSAASPKGRAEIIEDSRRSPGVVKQAIAEATAAISAAEPAKRIAESMQIPKAQAANAEFSTKPTKDSQKLDVNSRPAARSDSLEESRSITPSSVETKIVGKNTNGSPKLQLPDGSTVPSFRAFAAVGLTQFSNESLGQSSSSSSLGFTVASAASSSQPKVAAAQPIAAAPRIASVRGAVSGSEVAAGGSSTGGGGGGGSAAGGSSSFGQGGGAGGVQAASSRGISGARAPSSQRAEIEQISSAQLESRSHSVEYLKQVKVEKTGDMMKMITGATKPRDLVRQPWFIDHLKDEKFRVQINDKGEKFGSDRPKVLWNLPVLLKENER
jgi:hypothetical protein